MIFDDDLKKSLQESIVKVVVQFFSFCSAASSSSGILNMGGLQIFAYIPGTDNDTCVRSQGLSLL